MVRRQVFGGMIVLGLLMVWAGIASAGSYVHTYTFDRPVLQDAGNGQVYPAMDGCWPKTDPPGRPVLPCLTAKLFFPADEQVQSIVVKPEPLIYLPGSYEVVPAAVPVPLSKGHLAERSVKNGSIYSCNALYPGETHVDMGIQMLKGVPVAVVHLCPVQFNPVTGELGYYPRMTVTVHTDSVARETKECGFMFRGLVEDQADILAAVDNKYDFMQAAQRFSGQTRNAGSRQYLILTTRNLLSAMHKLADYRASSAGGSLNTHIVLLEDIADSVSGVDLAQKMRNFIRDSYQNHGTQYVVLGGDAHGAPSRQTMPTRGCAASVEGTYDANIPCDLYFGCLDGPWDGNNNGIWGEVNDGTNGGDIDWHSEVYVGRINAATPERAEAQIDKIIEYELSIKPYKTLLVGEVLDNTPTYGGDKMDWVAGFMPEMPKSTLYDRDQFMHDWPGYLLTDFLSSNDFVWINHLGHSWVTINMKLTEDDISSITNDKYYFIYTQGCYPGSMDNREDREIYGYENSIIENMVMAQKRGPFAAVANSRYGWYIPGKVFNSASNLLHSYFIQQVMHGTVSVGKANQISKQYLDFSDSTYRWIAFETNLFGDPISALPSKESDNRVSLAGKVTCVGQPLSCIVLAGGRYTFSGADGSYSLNNIPLEADGSVTLMCFGDGLAPYQERLTPTTAFVKKNISMEASTGEEPIIEITYTSSEASPGWVHVSGTLTDAQKNPVSGIVLANGQYTFSLGVDGSFELTAPKDSQGQITLFAFASGFAPAKVILAGQPGWMSARLQ